MTASLVLHAAVLLWFGGNGATHSSSPANDRPAIEVLQVRLLTPSASVSLSEPTSPLLETSDLAADVSQEPLPAPPSLSQGTAVAESGSESIQGFEGVLPPVGTVIDLGSGKELASSYWIGARLISPPLTVAVTVNPSGFIDAWEITPAFDLSSIPSGSIEHLVRRIPVKRTGETHITVYEFVLGIQDEVAIANLYSPSR